MNCQRTNARVAGDAALRPHPSKNEDRICLLHGTLDECFSGEVWNIANIFAARIVTLMAAGLQKALSCAAGDFLRSP
jgi:hypothetical protein